MQVKYKVISHSDKLVKIAPTDIEACASCKNRTCNDNSSFYAKNKLNLKLDIGAKVGIKVSAKSQILQAFFAIGIPILFAFLFYYLATLTVVNIKESVKILFVFIGLITGSFFVLIVGKKINLSLPEIYKTY